MLPERVEVVKRCPPRPASTAPWRWRAWRG